MFVGYELFGIFGVIIGIPIAGCLKIILAKWVPVMGSRPSVKAPKEPFLLDVQQGARNAWQFLQRVYGWLEAEATPAAPPAQSGREPVGEDADMGNDQGAVGDAKILTEDANEED